MTFLKAIFPTVLLSLSLFLQCEGQTYEQVLNLHEYKVNNRLYSTDVRPLRNQSNILPVFVGISLQSIVEVTDVDQRITINAFLRFNWTDEIIAWNPEDYGGVAYIFPKVEEIWKPRVVLVNSVQDQDPFKDDICSLFVRYDGLVSWYPGGLISVSCPLDVTNFPFDVQNCSFLFLSMNHFSDQMMFYAESEEMNISLFTNNSEWYLEKTLIVTDVAYASHKISSLTYSMSFRRRSSSFVITVLLPVSLLSFLNILIFIIPVESGENVNYGITLMLAQAVYMTTLTNTLPESSKNVPHVTIYVFCVLMISVFNVVIGVLLVFLHSRTMKHHSLINRLKVKANHTVTLGQPDGFNVTRSQPSNNIGGDISKIHAIPENTTSCQNWIKHGSCLLSLLACVTVTCWFVIGVFI